MGICRSWSSRIVWYYSCSFQEKEIIEFKGPAQAGLLFYAIFDILCLKEIKRMFGEEEKYAKKEDLYAFISRKLQKIYKF